MLAASFVDSVDAHGLHNLKMRGVVAVTCVNEGTWINGVIGCGMVLRIRHALMLIMMVMVVKS